MTRIMMILNQIQAGLGGEENCNMEPGGKKGPMGPGLMMEPFLKSSNCEIIATLYCGDQLFLDNKEELTKKMVAMSKKVNPDVIICGPAFNYEKFGEMAGYLAKEIKLLTDIPTLAAMSEENIAKDKYKHSIFIVKTPKKGGVGLTESLNKMVILAKHIANKEDVKNPEDFGCFI